MLSILQALSQVATAAAPVGATPVVRVVWVVRDLAIARFMWPTLCSCLAGLVDVTVALWVTSPLPPPTAVQPAGPLAPVSTFRLPDGADVPVHHGRPNMQTYTKLFPADAALSVYVCGPEGLMEAAAAACSRRDSAPTYLHQETFSF